METQTSRVIPFGVCAPSIHQLWPALYRTLYLLCLPIKKSTGYNFFVQSLVCLHPLFQISKTWERMKIESSAMTVCLPVWGTPCVLEASDLPSVGRPAASQSSLWGGTDCSAPGPAYLMLNTHFLLVSGWAAVFWGLFVYLKLEISCWIWKLGKWPGNFRFLVPYIQQHQVHILEWQHPVRSE